MRARLHLTNMLDIDELVALEYGRVDEGTREEDWWSVGEDVGYLWDFELGRAAGFKVQRVSAFDPEALEVRAIWGPPLFDAPVVGLRAASAGEIVVAAHALFRGCSSIGHMFFQRAAAARGEEALELWLCALEAGESAAHWGAGTTLYKLGRYREAYRHLRYYTEISPELSWSWCAYARAAEALGLWEEAATAYRRAVDLEDRGDDATGAREDLARFERDRRPRRLRRARRR